MSVLDIFDVIGGDGIRASSVAASLDALGGDDVIVRINSMGGDVHEGLAIHSLLKSYSGRVVVHVIGVAASMASVIAMAGDSVKMAGSAVLMIHNPWTMAIGDADEMRESADILDKMRDSLVKAYAAKSGLSRELIVEHMRAETWLDVDEAIELGYADGAIESADLPSIAVAALRRNRAFAKLFHRSDMARRASNYMADLLNTRRNETKDKHTMDRAKILKALGLGPDVSDDDIVQACAALKQRPAPDSVVPKADFEHLASKLSEARSKVQAMEEARLYAAVDAAIDEALREGKIPPASVEYHRANCLRDGGLESFKAMVAAVPSILDDDQMRRAASANAGSDPVVVVSNAERKIFRALGISEEDYIAQKRKGA